MMSTGAESFQWPDYLVLSVVLIISAAIGFYYAFTGGRQKSTKEYLFADKNMHWLPVSCSLLASYTSSLGIISQPGEIYSYGTIFIYNTIFAPFGVLLACKYYIPMFERLKIVSVYKYIEWRFGKMVKTLVAFTSVFNLLMYCGLVIYGPALSISAVTGMDIWASVFIVLAISTLYTVMGGMKAVLWTDTLQLGIIFVGLITMITVGSVREGGAAAVVRANKISGRFDMFDAKKVFSLDPRTRHTVWNMGINSVLNGVSLYGISQTSVMRAISLRPNHRANCYAATAGMSLVFNLLTSAMGLIMFVGFRYCDPIKDGVIRSKDQYYPLYVMRILGHLPGMPGFILSAVLSGSLSTLSSMLTAIAAILMEDGIRPWRPNTSDKATTIINKVLAVAAGVVSVIFVVFAMNFGASIITLILTFTAIFGGPSMGLFSMGIFMPFINSRGAVIGYLVGAAWGFLIGIGGLLNRTYIYKYPVSTAGCNVTDLSQLANITSPVYNPATWNPAEHYNHGFSALFDVSYAWVNIIGIAVTIFVGSVASLIVEKVTNKIETVNNQLISPDVLESRFLPDSWKARVDYTDDLSLMSDNYKPADDKQSDNTDRIDASPSAENKGEWIDLTQNENT